jgi:hypothetical protein
MGIEYLAAIAEDDYQAFKIILTTTLPRDYEMWLRVRERAKVRAFKERAVILTEVEVSPKEFGAYCKGLKRPDFSIATLDRCAREFSPKTAAAQPRAPASPRPCESAQRPRQPMPI